MNREKINKLRKEFGIDNPQVKIYYPKEFLSKFNELIEKLDKVNDSKIDGFLAKISELFKEQLKKNIESYALLDKKIDDRFNGLKEIKVNNFPEPIKIPEPKEIKIPKYPKEIEIKKPKWYEKFVPDKIVEAINKGTKQNKSDFENALDRHKELKNALAVRLASNNLETFYNAVSQAVSGMRTLTAADVVTAQVNNWPVDYPDATALAQLQIIVTALQLIDNFISGNRGLVTEDNSAAIKIALEIIDDWDLSDHCNIRHLNGTDDVVTANLSAIDNAVLDDIAANQTDNSQTSNQVNLVWLESNSFDVDNSSVQLVDTDGSTSGAADLLSTCKYISITNAGDGDLFIRIGGSAPVADGSTAYYDFKLAKGETRWLPLGYKAATSSANDVYGIRSAAQTNDNVIVTQWGYGS